MGTYIYKLNPKNIVTTDNGEKVALYSYWYKDFYSMFPTPQENRWMSNVERTVNRLKEGHDGGYDTYVIGDNLKNDMPVFKSKCKFITFGDTGNEDKSIGVLKCKKVGRKKIWYIEPNKYTVTWHQNGHSISFANKNHVKEYISINSPELNQTLKAIDMFDEQGVSSISYDTITVSKGVPVS